MFRPFYRIASDFECSGTGLGLAITEKIIKNHGWNINAKNVTGGLEFRIILPVY
jgi:signal transduction histidine kinase